MTDTEFDNSLYRYYKELLRYPGKKSMDEYDLLWMAAMRCALEVDKAAVWAFCERAKPLMSKRRLQLTQFMAFKKIATRNHRAKNVDLDEVYGQLKARLRKDRE